jgi:hypothetical protein
MSSRWFVWFPVVAVVLAALLAGGGYAVYRGGWEAGYNAGKAFAEDDVSEGVQPGSSIQYAWRSFSVCPVALGVFLFLMALGAVSHSFRMLAWRKTGAAWPGGFRGPWMRHWYWRHCPDHPHDWPHPGWDAACPPGQQAEQAPAAPEE